MIKIKNVFSYMAIAFLSISCSVSQKVQEEDNQDQILFLGNSIVELWEKHDTAFFNKYNISNAGVSGETSRQILERMDREVKDHNPEIIVIISPLTNDVAQNEGPVPDSIMLGNVEKMINKGKEHGCNVLLTSNVPCAYFFWNEEVYPARKIAQLNNDLKQMAINKGIPYVDFAGMGDENGALPQSFTDDGCHPNDSGYFVMKTIVSSFLDYVK